MDEIDLVAKSGSRGTRADRGIRPTIFAEFSELENKRHWPGMPVPHSTDEFKTP
jgi:hypothetical protein